MNIASLKVTPGFVAKALDTTPQLMTARLGSGRISIAQAADTLVKELPADSPAFLGAATVTAKRAAIRSRLLGHLGDDIVDASSLTATARAKIPVAYGRTGTPFAARVHVEGTADAVDATAQLKSALQRMNDVQDAVAVPVAPDAAATDAAAGASRLGSGLSSLLQSRNGRIGIAAGLGVLGGGVLIASTHGGGDDTSAATPTSSVTAAANGGAPNGTTGKRVTGPSASASDDTTKAKIVATLVSVAGRNIKDIDKNGTLDPKVADFQRANGQAPSSEYDWSDDMIVWAAKQHGVKLGPGGIGFHTRTDLRDWADSRGVWRPAPAAKPHTGDIVLLNTTNDSSAIDRAAIVESVDPATGELTIIEGNHLTGAKVNGVPVGTVFRGKLAGDASTIVGYVDMVDGAHAEVAYQAKVAADAKHRTSATMPVVSADAPTAADIMKFIDWSAAQYAKDDKQYQELSNLLKNVAWRENGFRVHALNLWDSNAVKRIPSSGMFQYIRSTFDAFSYDAKQSNPAAWKQLGSTSYTDWRAQALATAWALSQPPTKWSRANLGWEGAHGQLWRHWASIYNMRHDGIDPLGDMWKSKLATPNLDASIRRSVDDATVYPPGWRSIGKVYTHEQLTQIEKTGKMTNLPFYPTGG